MRLTLTLAAALLLAGCASTTPPDDTTGTGPLRLGPGPDGPGALPNGTLAPAAATLEDCAHHEGMFDIDEAAVSSVAPPGFAAAGTPTLVVVALRCTWDHQTFSAMYGAIPVTAPAEYATGADSHRLVLSGINTHEAVRSLLAAWGVAPMGQAGDATVLVPAPRPAPGVSRSVASNDNLTLDIYVSVSGSPANALEETQRNIVVDEGQVVGMFDAALPIRPHLSGTAVLQTSGVDAPPAPAQPNGQAREFDVYDVTLSYVPLPTTAGA